MQKTIYSISRTAKDYRANKVPISVIYEQGYLLEPLSLSQFTRLLTDEDIVVKGFIVGQKDDTLIITKGVGIADRRLIALDRELRIPVTDDITHDLEPGKQYYLILHIDTSVNLPIDANENCVYIDRGNADVILATGKISGSTNDHMHIYLPIAVVTYLGQNVFRTDLHKTISLRYSYPNYSIPYINQATVVRNEQQTWISNIANRYRYLLNGFGVTYDHNKQQIIIDSGAINLHGFVKVVDRFVFDFVDVLKRVYEYENAMYGRSVTNPTTLYGRRFIIGYRFSYNYDFDDWFIAEAMYFEDLGNLDVLFSVPVCIIDFRPALGPIFKGVW